MAVKPDWLRVKAPQWERVGNVKEVLRDLGLNTVCEEASCPNIGECFNQGTATFLIMGPACTRACPYCDIDFEKKPQALDPMEPINLGEAVRRMNLKHVVITSVNRERLYRRVRPQGDYQRSLELLRRTREIAPWVYTKSGIMVGMSETDAEVREVMRDLRAVDCDIITIGQYLQPSAKHLTLHEFVTPKQFEAWRIVGEEMGFLQVVSSPLTRSSYHAEHVQALMKLYPKEV